MSLHRTACVYSGWTLWLESPPDGNVPDFNKEGTSKVVERHLVSSLETTGPKNHRNPTDADLVAVFRQCMAVFNAQDHRTFKEHLERVRDLCNRNNAEMTRLRQEVDKSDAAYREVKRQLDVWMNPPPSRRR